MLRNVIQNTVARIRSSRPNRRRCRKAAQPADAQLLEQRTMLTGNVTASFSRGTLTLTGDQADNSVVVAVPDGFADQAIQFLLNDDIVVLVALLV